jgi:oligopeptidase B
MKAFSSVLTLLILSLCFINCNESNKASDMDSNQKSSLIMNHNNFKAPVAFAEPSSLENHGDTRVDDYYWMKLSDEQKIAENPDEATNKVVTYLNEENDYREKVTAELQPFEDKLFEEIKGRIKQTDMSVPYKHNGYYYITRYEEGKEYPIYARKKSNLDAAEEILLEVNQLAEGHEYYAVSGNTVSPDNKILAYGVDTLSRRQYAIHFKDLVSGENLKDLIPNTTGGVTWANDNKTVFYTVKDQALRSYKIFKHILGTDYKNDKEIYHEKDETFSTFVYKTKSEKYLVIGSYASLSREYRILDANDPNGEFKIFSPRQVKMEYSINHFEGNWYVLTNKDGAENYKLMVTPESATTVENWKEYIPHRSDVLLESVDLFKDYLVLSERIEGLTKLRVKPWGDKEEHYINFGENAYTASTSVNMDFDTEILRLAYTSMTTPSSVYDYNMSTKNLELLKEQEVLGDFDKNNYVSERIMVTARDGAQVPVSIVYKKGFKKDGSQPFLLYGYGSYGASMDPYFSSPRLSLLDRGFGFAIAHIRGGMEMGRQWYENGKFLKKKNTFNDFIDCGKYLVDNKYAASDKLFGMGGSAGGLLIGAVINMEPKMWAGVVAAVPFVDVVTTMLDESIP